MVIIVEGPDKVGKSTFAKGLAKEHGMLYFKRSLPGFTEGDYYRNDLMHELNSYGQTSVLDFIKQNELDVVLDRFHLSHYVYTTCLKRNNALMETYTVLDQVLASIDARLIIMTAPTMFVHDDLIASEEWYKISGMYQDIAKGRLNVTDLRIAHIRAQSNFMPHYDLETYFPCTDT